MMMSFAKIIHAKGSHYSATDLDNAPNRSCQSDELEREPDIQEIGDESS
jgi:hypothetical protein